MEKDLLKIKTEIEEMKDEEMSLEEMKQKLKEMVEQKKRNDAFFIEDVNFFNYCNRIYNSIDDEGEIKYAVLRENKGLQELSRSELDRLFEENFKYFRDSVKNRPEEIAKIFISVFNRESNDKILNIAYFIYFLVCVQYKLLDYRVSDNIVKMLFIECIYKRLQIESQSNFKFNKSELKNLITEIVEDIFRFVKRHHIKIKPDMNFKDFVDRTLNRSFNKQNIVKTLKERKLEVSDISLDYSYFDFLALDVCDKDELINEEIEDYVKSIIISAKISKDGPLYIEKFKKCFNSMINQ